MQRSSNKELTILNDSKSVPAGLSLAIKSSADYFCRKRVSPGSNQVFIFVLCLSFIKDDVGHLWGQDLNTCLEMLGQ